MRAAGASSAAAVTTAGYLLFSGPLDQPDDEHCRPTGFDCEESARLAFVRLRLQSSSESLWAELVAVHPDAKPRTLCWFGTPTNRADHLVRVATARDVNRLGSLSHQHLRMGIITRLRKGGGTGVNLHPKRTQVDFRVSKSGGDFGVGTGQAGDGATGSSVTRSGS